MPSTLKAKKNLKAIIPQSSVKTVRKLADDLGFRLWQAMFAEVSVLEKPIFMIGCPRCRFVQSLDCRANCSKNRGTESDG